jgi:hypothetical protein
VFRALSGTISDFAIQKPLLSEPEATLPQYQHEAAALQATFGGALAIRNVTGRRKAEAAAVRDITDRLRLEEMRREIKDKPGDARTGAKCSPSPSDGAT